MGWVIPGPRAPEVPPTLPRISACRLQRRRIRRLESSYIGTCFPGESGNAISIPRFVHPSAFVLPMKSFRYVLPAGCRRCVQSFDEFDQLHAEEVADPTRLSEAMFLVEAHRALKRKSDIQTDPRAAHFTQFGLDRANQSSRDINPVPRRADRHSAYADLFRPDDITGHRADDLAR